MKERDYDKKCDVTYPFVKKDSKGEVIETIHKPPLYRVKFSYLKSVTANRDIPSNPVFKIFC